MMPFRKGPSPLAAVLLAGFAVACQPAADSRLSGLDTENSNIAVEGYDLASIESLRLLPNTKVPKGFVVSLTAFNAQFVRTLYDVVHRVNEMEGLEGLEGPDQEITMVVVNNADWRYEELEADLRERRGLDAFGKIPYLARIKGPSDNDLWQQDWGEFAMVQVAGRAEPVYAVMESGRGIWTGYGRADSRVFADVFKLPFIKITDRAIGDVGSGNFGGNTEATPDGALYYGDRLTDESMLNRLRRLGNDDMIEIPSAWLHVGHVDEYVTFIPSTDVCGHSLVAASPLDGLNLLAAGHAGDDLGGIGFPRVTVQELRDALAHFRRDGVALAASYRLADLDARKAPRIGYRELDRYVQKNLEVEAVVRDGVSTLVANTSCLEDVVTVPQVFSEEEGRAVATLGGTTNMLVLRDHLVIPEPKRDFDTPPVQAIRDRIRDVLAPRVGGGEKIHFIDTSPYHTRMGEIHCGTNVVREMSLDVVVD